jgi:hypothetical protein
MEDTTCSVSLGSCGSYYRDLPDQIHADEEYDSYGGCTSSDEEGEDPNGSIGDESGQSPPTMTETSHASYSTIQPLNCESSAASADNFDNGESSAASADNVDNDGSVSVPILNRIQGAFMCVRIAVALLL